MRQVDEYAAEGDLRSEVVLVAVGAEDPDVALAGGLEDAESGGIRVLEEDIRASPDLRESPAS